ncbi:aminotransferase class V-fold PLP-dependent enzyme [Aureispira anguillae]|uniref:cysteine desulfurase n=1 Tax=Aureispira anguillae TaxID=2864201 RepID=A0A915YKT8_9BACT|nr:aminotransferase class V-fold PLP-dependent enzyme [Aureispira anguillae]BDS15065.1 aminotransferase class V-fold PLP-dependent enzyme [Aureispira anguillae]
MKELIYLNNAATSFPKPPNVLQAVNASLMVPPIHALRNGFGSGSNSLSKECRTILAQLFNVPHSEQIVFTSGATESLNLAIKGLELEGKHIITSNMEHNSVLRLLKTLERNQTINLSIVPSNSLGQINWNAIKNELRPTTAAVILNHCSNVTGALNDLKTIGTALAKKNIPFIVDASQSAGLYPIDVQEMQIDILAFTGHKALYGIAGIGGIYIKKGLHLKPLKIGGTGSKSDYLYQPSSLPIYYEAGTPNYLGITSLYEGVKFIKTTGIEHIRQKIQHYVYQIRHFLAQYPNVISYPNTAHYSFQSTLLSFSVQGLEVSDIGYLLEQNYNIVVRTGLHCAPLIHESIGSAPYGTVRISPSFFTTEAEINSFLQAMKEILTLTI